MLPSPTLPDGALRNIEVGRVLEVNEALQSSQGNKANKERTNAGETGRTGKATKTSESNTRSEVSSGLIDIVEAGKDSSALISKGSEVSTVSATVSASKLIRVNETQNVQRAEKKENRQDGSARPKDRKNDEEEDGQGSATTARRSRTQNVSIGNEGSAEKRANKDRLSKDHVGRDTKRKKRRLENSMQGGQEMKGCRKGSRTIKFLISPKLGNSTRDERKTPKTSASASKTGTVGTSGSSFRSLLQHLPSFKPV